MDKHEMLEKLEIFITCAENGIQVKDIGDVDEEYAPYSGKYFVLSTGEVWSKHKKDFLKPYHNHRGYCIVDLRDGENRKQVRVHRLVAQAFIPNPDNLPTVNHQDENKDNNDVSNLSWMTIGDNVRYGTGIARCAQARMRPVRCIETGEIYESITKAAEAVNGEESNLCAAIKRNGTHRKYHWEYVKKDEV